MLSYSATLANGSALPSWLTFNSSTRTFNGSVPRDATGAFDVEVVADDGHGNSEVPSSASDIFTITIGASGSGGGGGGGGGGGSNGNEGVGNGQDAPPPGHDHSFNDGLGTSPGNPGAKGGNGYVPLEPRHAPSLGAHALTAPTALGMATHGHSGKLTVGDNNGLHNGGNAPQGQPGGGSGNANGHDAAAALAAQSTSGSASAADAPAAGAGSDSASTAPTDASAQVAAQLGQDPQYDYAALFAWLENEASSTEVLDAAEIARRWGRVARYAVEHDNGTADAAHAAAYGWQRFADAFAAANAGGSASFDQFVGLGVASGLPGIDTFKGLNDGFARL